MTGARVWLLALLLLVVSGCSTIRIAYNQADHIVAWIADDYFDLTSEQEQALREPLERFHAWHRRTQLPEYAALLENVQQRVSAGTKLNDADWLAEAIKLRYRAVVLHAHADAAAVLATLSDTQLLATRRHFDKINRKYVKDNGVGASADEQRRLRERRMLERIEHWTGPLDAPLETKLRDLSRGLPLITDAAYRERLRRQEEFMRLLQSRQAPDFASRLRDWLLEWDRTRSAEYQPQYARFIQARNSMYVEVLGVATPEQRAHVLSVLRRYQNAFRELAAQAPARQAATQP